MGFQGADLDKKEVCPVVLGPDDEPGHHNSVCGGECQSTRPVFGTREGGRVNDQLICLLIKCGCRLESAEERSMAQFCLDVAPDHLTILDQRQPSSPLLGAGLPVQCRAEHERIMPKGRGDGERILVGVGIEDGVAVLDLVVHDGLAKFEPEEILSLPVCISVGRRYPHRVLEFQRDLDSIKCCLSFIGLLFPIS